jgi:hypothetical protein
MKHLTYCGFSVGVVVGWFQSSLYMSEEWIAEAQRRYA